MVSKAGAAPMNERRVLEFDALGSFSKRFASALFAAFPNVRVHSEMIQSGENDGLSIDIRVPSPSGENDRLIEIWVDEKATPSIGFGPDHTHRNPDESGITEVIELLRAILDGRLLIIQYVGGEYAKFGRWLDLREPDALEDELTSECSPGRATLKSWSGEADRVVGLESL